MVWDRRLWCICAPEISSCATSPPLRVSSSPICSSGAAREHVRCSCRRSRCPRGHVSPPLHATRAATMHVGWDFPPWECSSRDLQGMVAGHDRRASTSLDLLRHKLGELAGGDVADCVWLRLVHPPCALRCPPRCAALGRRRGPWVSSGQAWAQAEMGRSGLGPGRRLQDMGLTGRQI